MILAASRLAAGCAADRRPPAARYTIDVGAATATVEVAATPRARAEGLSGRRELAADEGMLFIFPEPARAGFWMKDTFVGLSIAFITPAGRIAEIQHMEPRTLEKHAPGQPFLMALEMPAGWFERNGVKVGDHLVLPGALGRIKAY